MSDLLAYLEFGEAGDPQVDRMRLALSYYDASYPPSIFPGASSDPHVASLAPATGVDGTPVTVTVHGLRFDPDAQVEVDGIAVTTTYVSASQLTAHYSPAIGGDATVIFTVRNVGTSLESNDVPFEVTASQAQQDEQPVQGREVSPESSDEPQPGDEGTGQVSDDPPPNPRRRRRD